MPGADGEVPADDIPGPIGPRFVGRVAIVTGGGGPELASPSNVGAAVSRLLAREGCHVAVLDRDRAAADRTVAQIGRDGGKAFPIECDISVHEDCRRAVASTIAVAGRLDVLVNNIGIHIGRENSVVDVDLDEWERTMSINARGTMLMVKYAIPQMPKGGAIVNVSSAGATHWGYNGGLAYGVSKGAVNAMTLGLAVHEGSREIRVNCVCPGGSFTSSRLHGSSDSRKDRDRSRRVSALGTEGTAWDMAHAVVFLASDQARWITGQILTVDGGAHIRSISTFVK